MTHPGMIVDRRAFIMMSAAGPVVLSGGASAAPDESAFTALMTSLEQLGDELPLATSAEQNAYIYRLAARAMLVQDFPMPPNMGAMGNTGIQIRPLARTEPPTDRVHGVALVSYRMAPGALLQAHNHPNYSVATIGIEGAARVTHYEPPADAPPFASRDSFLVQKTAERLLRAREASTLSPARDNIHTFEAGPSGARFVDLFSIHGEDVGFSYLDVEPAPASPAGDRFQARWAGDRPTGA